MWHNVLILMLTVRLLTGTVVCCCTTSAWTSLTGSPTEANCCCGSPEEQSRQTDPCRPGHRCSCQAKLTFAKLDGTHFNVESSSAAAWFAKVDLLAPAFCWSPNRAWDPSPVPADVAAGPFAHCSGTEILRLLQTMRC